MGRVTGRKREPVSDRIVYFLRVFAFCALALIAGAAPAHAQRRKEPALAPAPPPVIPREIRVEHGESVTIPLGIHGTRTEQLQFLVRIPPKRGKVSRVELTGMNSAQITYTAPKAGDEDRFAYAVRSKEGVSAPGVVTITFVGKAMAPSRLVVPESLDFPTVVTGQQSSALIDVENQGGGLVQGEMTVSPPWTVVGPPAYRLGAGARMTFKLVFQPEKAGNFKGEAIFGPDPRRAVTLVGQAQTPLTVTPERLKLHAPIGGQTRKATLTIENRSDEPRQVALAAGARLMTDKSVEVAAKGKVEVPVFADPTDATAFEDKLRVTSGDWSAEIPVEVGAVAAVVKFSADPSSPARVAHGQRAELSAVLENRGGQPASVKVRVEPPFEVVEKELNLPAAGKATVRITASALSPGQQKAVLRAEGEGISEAFTVNVEVGDTSPAPPPPTVPAGSVVKPVKKTAEKENSAEADPPQRSVNAMNWIQPVGREEHPNALGRFAKDIGPYRATLVWPASLGSSDNLSIEERRLAVAADGGLVVTWLPLAGVSFDVAGDPRRAELPRLEPARPYVVRVRSGDETLFTAQFSTLPKPPWYPFGWQSTTITLLLAALVGGGWWRWKTSVRSSW
jgi:hypothetical protein